MTEIAILPARTREWAGKEEFSKYVANFNQSRSAFIRAPNVYFICYISSVLFVCSLVAASFCVPLPPGCRHRSCLQQVGTYVPFFPQSGFGFSYPAVLYLVSFEVCVFRRAFSN